MMKKYNKPTIEALALETIDVIAASGADVAAAELADKLGVQPGQVKAIAQDIVDMKNQWSW
jgi:hypothetical protein